MDEYLFVNYPRFVAINTEFKKMRSEQRFKKQENFLYEIIENPLAYEHPNTRISAIISLVLPGMKASFLV